MSRRLSLPERRRQLLDVALSIVREEGVDSLTLGHLASQAGVSKPVAYDHFGTRSRLLIDLYRQIDTARVRDFRKAMHDVQRGVEDTVNALANAYIDCAAETQGEFFAIRAALAGSEEKETVYQELADNYVVMFVEVLAEHSALDRTDLEHYCIGLVGAGEALSTALVRGRIDAAKAAKTLAALLQRAI